MLVRCCTRGPRIRYACLTRKIITRCILIYVQRIVPGASDSLSKWLANIGMHNFNWVWDDSPSNSSARPSATPTPSSGHRHPSSTPSPSSSWSHTSSFSPSSTPSSTPSPTPSPTLHYYDPYATYFVYPTTTSTSTFHSWDIHHPSPLSTPVHNILETPTPFSSTYHPTATPMLSWGPRPTPSSFVKVTPSRTPSPSPVRVTPSPTLIPTPSHGHGSATPQPSKAKNEPSKDDGDEEQDPVWNAFYDSLSGRIRDALDSSDELWL